jgi:hypothetical protein
MMIKKTLMMLVICSKNSAMRAVIGAKHQVIILKIRPERRFTCLGGVRSFWTGGARFSGASKTWTSDNQTTGRAQWLNKPSGFKVPLEMFRPERSI